MAMSIAKFPYVRDLAGFDFNAQPSLDPEADPRSRDRPVVANGESVLLLGPPGSARRTWRWRSAATRSSPATRAVHPGDRRWSRARQGARRGTARGQAHPLTKPRLLIVDELGYLPFEPDAAHLFFQLVSRSEIGRAVRWLADPGGGWGSTGAAWLAGAEGAGGMPLAWPDVGNQEVARNPVG